MEKGNGPMSREPEMPTVVISTDGNFRRAVREAADRPDCPMHVELEVESPFDEIVDAKLEQLADAAPGVVFLDLGEDPETGLKFAEFLMDSYPGHTLVASGESVESDLLLRVMHAGVREFLPKPLAGEKVVEAMERICRRRQPASGGGPRKGRIVSVFGVKGGVGSTTLSVNLAVGLRQATGARTVLVDLDVGLGEAAVMAGLEPRYSILDALKNVHRVDAGLLASLIESTPSGIDVLAAPYQPTDFEAVSGAKVGQLLRLLREHYDWVVVDLPCTFNPTIFAALEESDRLMLVTTADLPAIRNITRFLPLLRNTSRRPVESWLRVILNRYNPRDTITPPEIEDTVGLKVDWTVRNDYRSVMTSINTGDPLVLDGNGPYASDVRRLARRLSGQEPEKKKGPLLRIPLFGRGGGSSSSREDAR